MTSISDSLTSWWCFCKKKHTHTQKLLSCLIILIFSYLLKRMPARHFMVWMCLSQMHNMTSWIFLMSFIHTLLYVFSLLVKMFFPSSSTSISFWEAFGFGLSLCFYIVTWKDFWLFVCSPIQLWVPRYSRCFHGTSNFGNCLLFRIHTFLPSAFQDFLYFLMISDK